MTRVLLTGGAGYIGSHVYVALVQAGFTPVILDNFSNSHAAVLERLERITGKPVLCEQGDISDATVARDILARHEFAAVIHLASFKSPGESAGELLAFYRNNLCGTINLMQAMESSGCRTLVFSSSAAVYGNPATTAVAENSVRACTNSYGHTKLVCEDVLTAVHKADPAWRIGTLRYFNPAGAHSSGLIGEAPAGISSNLMLYMAHVAAGRRPCLNVYGNDYPTPDGTGVRDYVHVMDLALGHVAALESLLKREASFTVNLGSGRGYSVLEAVHAFEQACGQQIPCRFVPRRPGDVAQCCADVSLAASLLGWRALRTLPEMCRDTWRWLQSNPNGYKQHPG